MLHLKVLTQDRHSHVATMGPCGPEIKDGKPADPTQESA